MQQKESFKIWLKNKISEENQKDENDNYRYGYDDDEESINYYQLIEERSGGNCWGGRPKKYIIEDRQRPTFFMNLCLLLNENFPLKAYLELEKMIQKSEKSQSEYYGNGRTYSVESLALKDILTIIDNYDILIDENLWLNWDKFSQKRNIKY